MDLPTDATPLLSGSVQHGAHPPQPVDGRPKSFRARLKRFLRDPNVLNAAVSILIGFIIAHIPPPEGLTRTAMQLLGVFVSVILTLLCTEITISIVVLNGLLVLILADSFMCTTEDGKVIECRLCDTEDRIGGGTHISYKCDGRQGSLKVALSGFSMPLSFLVLAAFHIGHAVDATGLGRRVSLLLVKYMGGSLLGLGYALTASELLLGPFIPSNTARGGGILMPITMSLAQVLGSTPSENPETGSFLVLCGNHANFIASSMFVTGTVGNPLIVGQAAAVFNLEFGFVRWFVGAVVPGLVVAALIPLILSKFVRTSYNACAVRSLAKQELSRMGPLSSKEIQVLSVLILCLALWVSGSSLDMPEAYVALLGISLLLMMGTISWNEVIENSKAWDSYFWLSGMVLIADQISKLGLARWFGNFCVGFLESAHLSPLTSTISISTIYFLSMLMFSSLTGHIVALVSPLMEAGKQLGCHSRILTACLAYFSSLAGSLTNYSSGSSAIYFGQGFVDRKTWFLVGGGVGLVHLGVYFTVGMFWWTILGWGASA
ncbi:Sodium/sulfate symporter [Polychytrium aggregatum]|uniref:Sodium/sulfate symporter n=1 Tax=Polychytrium aggregatum TaxID=110093 RepID=UPI0022FF1AC4|nr:Sodium/sulfate symporter [Polychytrium aggregatum]KAI9199614.1 Sodium/sulfate symporter [Polychytrium aggregatum]